MCDEKLVISLKKKGKLIRDIPKKNWSKLTIFLIKVYKYAQLTFETLINSKPTKQKKNNSIPPSKLYPPRL